MNTVAELVNKETIANRRRMKKYEAEEAAEKKKQDSKQFSAEVAYIIKQFEYNVFRLDSTNEEVAKFILDHKGRFLLTKADQISQQMPGYIYVKPFLESLKFYKTESMGRKHITGSSKYNKWKKSLEDKFGVKIIIERHYIYKERYGHSGYATYPDEIFQGVLVRVELRKTNN